MTKAQADNVDVTGLILCGGLARRLGGVDKGLHEVGGRPLVVHVLERMAPQASEIVVSANRNGDAYAALGHRVVADEKETFDGPLAGVLAALGACRTSWLVSAPCDAPHVPTDLVARLLSAAREGGVPTACVYDGERLQPTFCAYRRELAAPLRAYLDGGGRKIDRFLEDVGLARADFTGRAEEFVNLNSPEDVARFESSWSSAR